MHTHIALDDDLLEKAMQLSHTNSKRELIDLALREFVSRHGAKKALDLVGQPLIDPEYDARSVRGLIDDGMQAARPAQKPLIPDDLASGITSDNSPHGADTGYGKPQDSEALPSLPEFPGQAPSDRKARLEPQAQRQEAFRLLDERRALRPRLNAEEIHEARIEVRQ